MAAEVMSFGTILTFFRGASNLVKRDVAAGFGVPHQVFSSWLLALNTVRNICAHHGRLWNRVLGTKPMIPYQRNDADWHVPVKVANDRLFAILTICQHCLRRIAPQSRWDDRLKDMLSKAPAIPIVEMGFPVDWQQCPIWSPRPHA
jgi:abortive infection bacteriophage resistance protein